MEAMPRTKSAARRTWAWSFALVLSACTVKGDVVDPTEDTAEPPEVTAAPSISPFSPATKRLALEVDYAAGAEPYTGDVWRIFGESAAALFDGTKEIAYPTALDEMERLDDVPAGTFATGDLVAIAARHRGMTSGAGTAALYVVFVDGIYVDPDGVPQPRVSGVTIGRTGTIAMFKHAVPPEAEQAALVHELGHAVGLVDLDVPATSAHVDRGHPRHCTNERCVMFWANEIAARGDRVLFGPECLADARALAQTLD